jgi:dihydropyrimidine dehydrogenase (NADP+)
MTPNITDVADPARAALNAGMEGIAAINTITSVIGIDLETLRPQPCVEGYSTPGGYSSKAVKPIALAKCMAIAKVIEEEHGGLKGENARSLSGIGGVERGSDAAEFILLGASTVQVPFCLNILEYLDLHSFVLLALLRRHPKPRFQFVSIAVL